MRGLQTPLASHFDAALVDLDGTLVDTLGDFVAALNAMLVDLNIDLRLQAPAVEALVGKGSENLIRSVLNMAFDQSIRAQYAIETIASGAAAENEGADVEAHFDAAFASYQRHYRVLNGRYAAVYPGAVEGLQALQQAGLRLVCLTNKPLAFARDLLKMKGLDSFFVEAFGGDSFARKKPDPMPLLEACKFLGTQPARTLMMGDSSNDAKAARAAGCPVLLVTYGYNHGEPVQTVDADGFVNSLSELKALL